MTKAERLAQALDRFLDVSVEVEAAAVVSGDGLPMASALPPHVHEDRLAAMSAALLTLGDRAADGLGKGELAQVFVEGATGYVILMAAGPDAVLVSVTSKEAKVGLILFEMRKAAADIRAVMEGVPEAPPLVPDMPAAPDHAGELEQHNVRPPEPTPAAEVVHPTVSAWE
jgi:predicted regulator of Ras-like GTPase activity (Roadblock/LC7/MglB family)